MTLSNIRTTVFLLAMTFLPTSALMAQVGASQPGTGFTILHTNDLHGHITSWQGWEGELAGKTVGGMDRLASVVQQIRGAIGASNVLLLDAGDTLGDTMIADETKGKTIIEVMNTIGYNAMVVGNHEPDFTARVLKQRVAEAKFPVLAANIIETRTGKFFTQPFIIKDVNGIRVGILGIAYPNTPFTTAKMNVQDLEFRDAVATVRSFIPKLKTAGAQIVIVLSHYGLSSDIKLAQQVPGIDIIVGGHSHNRMKNALREHNTLIVQAGAHGSDVGRLDLEVVKGKIVGHQHRLITLDNAVIPRDPQVGSLIDRALATHATKLNEYLAETRTPLSRAQTIAGETPRKRDQESLADSLFADIIREKTQADVVILPGLGYGVAIGAGKITANDLRNLIPHDSKTVTMTLTGDQIKEILEQSLENTYTDDPKQKVGGIVQVSGITFKYNAAGSYPQRLIAVRVNGAPLVMDRTYKIATNSLLAQGGHHYKSFLMGKNIEEKETQYLLVKKALQQRGTIQAPVPGRIVKTEGL